MRVARESDTILSCGMDAVAAQALEDARKAGIDLSLLDTNLALTPEERLLQHQMALNLAEALRHAGETTFVQSAATASEAR